jgi:uncharacterized MAPEG superfamily protein
MNPLLQLVLYMALLTWACVMAASLLRSRSWTAAGMTLALGNRETMPPATGLAGRAERTARNTVDNFVLFAAIALVAQAAGVLTPRVLTGAQLFFWARVVYVPVYWAGIPLLRTGVWAASIAGLVMMLSALL